MKQEPEVRNKIQELTKQIDYLYNFLQSIYKGSDAKPKAEQNLIALKKERDILCWVLNESDLPF